MATLPLDNWIVRSMVVVVGMDIRPIRIRCHSTMGFLCASKTDAGSMDLSVRWTAELVEAEELGMKAG